MIAHVYPFWQSLLDTMRVEEDIKQTIYYICQRHSEGVVRGISKLGQRIPRYHQDIMVWTW